MREVFLLEGCLLFIPFVKEDWGNVFLYLYALYLCIYFVIQLYFQINSALKTANHIFLSNLVSLACINIKSFWEICIMSKTYQIPMLEDAAGFLNPAFCLLWADRPWHRCWGSLQCRQKHRWCSRTEKSARILYWKEKHHATYFSSLCWCSKHHGVQFCETEGGTRSGCFLTTSKKQVTDNDDYHYYISSTTNLCLYIQKFCLEFEFLACTNHVWNWVTWKTTGYLCTMVCEIY